MSEAYLSIVTREMISQVGILLREEISLLLGVEDELQNLKDSILILRAKLLGAEEQQAQNHDIKNLLVRIKGAMYDADDLFDEIYCEAERTQPNHKVCYFISKSNFPSLNLRIAHKIKKLSQIIAKFSAQIGDLNIIEHIRDARDEQIRKRETQSFVLEEEIIGRDDVKNDIMEKLFDLNVENNVSVIAIVGIGGFGKTALAQSLYNNTRVKNHFELKIWVCVSEEFDVKTIIGKIIESATKKKPDDGVQDREVTKKTLDDLQDLEFLQTRMHGAIEGNKYLLVMDDVWNENDEKWMTLEPLLMGGARGSKIVITTRSRRVADIAKPISVFHIEGLSESNSWLLFEKIAFGKREGDQANDPDFIEIGEEIVKMLNGVPLAIRAIGRVLYSKTSKSEWISFRDDQLLTITKGENDMMSILKISYNNLPTHLKPCFTYCSLFPKDFFIDKRELIKLWIAQGFINQSQCLGKSMEDVGHDYFMELYWRSFFQDIQRDELGDIQEFKMHDLIHDLAKLVSSDEYIFIKNSDDLKNIDIKRTRHISLDLKDIFKWKIPKSTLEAKKVRSFLFPSSHKLYNYRVLHKQVFYRSISCFAHLRALNLSYSYIYVVPKTINKLKQLRYLDLSHNMIRSLPNSITKLKSLQTLDLSHCRGLQELPRNTSDLVNLRHLCIGECSMISLMPQGLSKLTCLQTMNLFVLGQKYASTGLDELKELHNLRGELVIKGLEYLRFHKKKALASGHAELKQKQGLRKIELYWKPFIIEIGESESRVDEIVLNELQPHSNLRFLSIKGYHGVGLSDWINGLSNLVEISIINCQRLQYLPRFDQYPLLQSLHLHGLLWIEYIDSNNNSSSLLFPSLQTLSLVNLQQLKKWCIRDFIAETRIDQHLSFPTLNSLSIGSCPVLDISNEGRLWKELRSLHFLRLNNLPRLVSLPNGLQYMSTLRILELSRCENLMTLPEWIGSLTSLLVLIIDECKKLESLPQGMRHLTLQKLKIADCHGNLVKRCIQETGEDWPLIAHIPKLIIY